MAQRIDETGQTYGKWTVLEYAGDRKWKCRCECGNEGVVLGSALRNGRSPHCNECKAKAATEDLTGRIFDRWEVKERRGSDKHRRPLWLCQCECGTLRVVPRDVLVKGDSTSCGCYQQEVLRQLRSESYEFQPPIFQDEQTFLRVLKQASDGKFLEMLSLAKPTRRVWSIVLQRITDSPDLYEPIYRIMLRPMFPSAPAGRSCKPKQYH